MKISRQYLLWLIVVAMFCVMSIGGCGGSSDNDNTPATQDEESGGSNNIGDDWEDLGFEMLSGAWKIDSTEMTLGNGVRPETDTTRLPFTMNATSAGYLSFTDLFGVTADDITNTFSGTNTDGEPIAARGMPLIAGGRYIAQTASSYWQVAQGDGVQEYYVIELSKSDTSSSTYDIMTFTDMRTYTNQIASEQNYRLTTVLHKIPESDPELEMAAGNWQIVSVDLREGLASELTESDKTGFFSLNEDSINPNIKLTVQDNGVYWGTDDGNFPTGDLMGEFMRLERDMGSDTDAAYDDTDEVTVPMIFPMTGYTKVSNGVFETSYVRDSNNQLDQERVEFLNNSWQTIRYTHSHFASTRSLAYGVTTILRRR